MNEQRIFAQSEQASVQESIKKEREEDKEKRTAIKIHQTSVLEVKWKEVEGYVKGDLERRDGFKQAIIKQIEDTVAKKLAQAADAARIAEKKLEDAAIIGEEVSGDAGKKKGKAGKAK